MPGTTEPPLLASEEFRAALLAAVSGSRVEDSRFFRILQSGRCPPAMVRRYGVTSLRSARSFCSALSEMVRQAPDAQSRLALLENLMEEEGVILQSDGMTMRHEAAHPQLALRFARAVGADDSAADEDDIISASHALLARGDWLGAVAHLLIGQELRFAENAPRLGEAFVGHGLAPRDTAFFAVHATADVRHGGEALDMVLRHAKTRALQDHCIAEARAGAQIWIDAHGGLVN